VFDARHRCDVIDVTALAVLACVGATLHFGPPPSRGAPLGPPWIRSGPVEGYLFYYSSLPADYRTQRAVIATHGGGPGWNTKILWRSAAGGRWLTLRGDRLDASGAFVQRYRRIVGGQYPSEVVIPAPGCWRLTLSTGGIVRRFAFLAIDA
jgi:hypothetical protein